MTSGFSLWPLKESLKSLNRALVNFHFLVLTVTSHYSHNSKAVTYSGLVGSMERNLEGRSIVPSAGTAAVEGNAPTEL